jgi:hypothetical protein
MDYGAVTQARAVACLEDDSASRALFPSSITLTTNCIVSFQIGAGSTFM